MLSLNSKVETAEQRLAYRKDFPLTRPLATLSPRERERKASVNSPLALRERGKGVRGLGSTCKARPSPNSEFRLSRRAHHLLRVVVLTSVTIATFPRPSQLGAQLLQTGKLKESPVKVPTGRASFETEVLPILKSTCIQCHGAAVKLKELDLSSYEGVMKGSEGGPVIVPGKAEESRLYKMVSEGIMPAGGKGRLSEPQLATIRSWIEAGAPAVSSAAAATPAAGKWTDQDIVPILLLRCTVCHGIRRQEGDLDLHTLAGILKGGKTGPVLIPGKPDESLIVKKIRSGEMPPKKRMLEVGVKPITTAETERLAQWIAQGAPVSEEVPDIAGNQPDPLVSDKDRQFWAFQPPRPAPVPTVRHAEQVRNPIDAFILSKLEEKGLGLSAEADRLVLIRRAYFDLTGLAPDPQEVQVFLADSDPRAYEKMIDRLLSSARYGERWGRHWLDVAGYSDSEGGKLSADHPRPVSFRYRDYVIRSFNDDKPYDRFLLEQIAGDELIDYEKASVITQEIMDNLVATGFLRMGPDSTSEREVNFVEDRLDVIGDEIDILGSGVLGLTIRCARCHSHKYDPIPQRDYYRLLDIFKGAFDEHDWLMPQQAGDGGKVMGTRFLPYIRPGATPAQLMQEEQDRETQNKVLDTEIEATKASLEQKAEPLKEKLLNHKIEQLPAVLREDLKKMLATPPEKRSPLERYLSEKFERALKIEPDELKSFDANYRKEAEAAERQIKLIEYGKQPEPKIQALWDRGVPSPSWILRRGEPANFGRWVGPGVPMVLTDGKTPFAVNPPWPGSSKTGRRLALARWLVRPDHPLTARVMVNRIWKHHFGAGIVKTLGNFGNTGARPSHPELLDWLATEFVRQGWSVKAMHRLMMTSSTYRQTSVVSPQLEKLDPDNLLLSRMPLKRMEAEVLNDTLLLVSGRLDETRFGVPQPVEVRDDGLVTPIEIEKGWRRSVYVTQRRSELPSLLENFDLPAMSPNCLERNASTVAPQALNLLNSAMIHRLAYSLAERVRKEAGPEPQKQIELAYRIALSRPPSLEERKASLETLTRLVEEERRSVSEGGAVHNKPATPATPVGDAAQTVGQDPIIKNREEPDLAALGKVCHTIMNSAAFMYID